MVKTLESTDISNIKLGVIKLYFTTCGPCKAYTKFFEQAAETLKDENIEFFELECSEDKSILYDNGLKTVPSTLFVKDGKVVESFSGARPAPTLVSMIEDSLLTK